MLVGNTRIGIMTGSDQAGCLTIKKNKNACYHTGEKKIHSHN